MTEGVSAGRLYVDVEGDTTGLSRDLQRKVDLAVADVRARIKTEIDARRLQADLDRAVRSSRATITVPAKVDRQKLAADLKAAVVYAQRNAGTVTIDVDADTAQAEAQIDQAARDRKATIEVDADTAGAEAEADDAKRRIGRTPATVKGKFDSSELLKGSMAVVGLMKFPAIAAGINLAGAAVAQLGAGLISLVSVAGQATGVLGLIPAAGSAIVAGIAPVVAGFIGVGAAVKAMSQQQKTATSTGNTLAAAQEAAAQRVVAAQRSLRDARQTAAEAAITSEEGVQRAEESLARAQRDASDAQSALNQARVEAAQRLKDYEDQLADASLSERGAQIAVERAQQALDATNRSATSTELDRREAQLTYDEAVQRQKELESKDQQLRAEAKKARREGVEGDAQVVKARRGVSDANQAVLDQEQGLADARRQQANQQRDSMQQLQQAQDSLTQAIKAQSQAQDRQTTASSAAAYAMNQLSPAGRRFATFLHGTLVPRLREVQSAAQEALLPPLQQGLTAAMRVLPNIDRLMGITGGIMGNVAKSALDMVSSGPWRRDFDTITNSSARSLKSIGGALNPILRVIRDLAVAGGPFVERFAKTIERGARSVSDFIATQRQLGEANPRQGLSGFFQRASSAAALLWGLLKNLGGALYNIGQAAAPAGRILFTSLDKATARLKEITEPGTRGGNRLKQYFLDAVPGVQAMGRFINGVVVMIGNLGRNKSIGALFDQLTTQFLPALTTALQSMSNSFGPAFVRLLTDLARLFGSLGGGSGGLTAAANALDLVVKALNALLSLPGVAPFISGLLAIGGAATGIGLAAGAIGKLGNRLGKVISKVPGATGLFKKLKGAIGLSTKEIDDELPKDKEKSDALGEVEGEGTKAADTLGKKLARGARAAGGALLGAGKAAGGFVKNIVRAGAEAAIAAGKFLLAKAQTALLAGAQLAQAAATRVAAAAQAVFNVVMDANPLALILIGVVALAAGIVLLWRKSETFRKIVTASFNAVWSAVKAVWNWVKHNWPLLLAILTGPIGLATLFISRHWDTIKGYFRSAISWITGAWRSFWNTLSSIGSSIWGGIRSGVYTVLNAIRSAFRSTVAAIKSIWHGLEAAARAPVAFVVNTVYNRGIRWAWNKVADLVHLPELPEAHFAKGGTVPGYAPGRDSVRAWLSPGEGVLVPETVRGLGGPQAIDALNSTYSSRVAGPTVKAGAPAFDGGGVLGSIWGATGGKIVGGVEWFGGKALGLIRAGAASAISGLLGPVRSWLNSVKNGSGWTAALAGMFNNLIDSVIAKIKGSTTETHPQGHATGGVVGGAPSTHDTVPAWLRPGEGILTPTTTAALGGAPGIAALNRDPVAAMLAASRSAGSSAPIYIDRSVTFESGAIKVENPVAEPASDSINTRMRRLAEVGVFGR